MFSTEVEVTFGEVKVILGFAKVLSTCTLCLRRGVAVDPTSVEGLLSIFKKEKKAWSNKNLEVAETRFSLLFLCTKYREIAKPSRFEHTLFSDCKFLLMSHFFSRKVETGFFSTFLVLKKTLSPLFCKKGAVKREGGKNVRNGPSFSLFFFVKKSEGSCGPSWRKQGVLPCFPIFAVGATKLFKRLSSQLRGV